MSKPACLEAGSSSGGGGDVDIVEMASQQVCEVSLFVAAVFVFDCYQLASAAASSNAVAGEFSLSHTYL
jgi:hypothetical protein